MKLTATRDFAGHKTGDEFDATEGAAKILTESGYAEAAKGKPSRAASTAKQGGGDSPAAER